MVESWEGRRQWKQVALDTLKVHFAGRDDQIGDGVDMRSKDRIKRGRELWCLQETN